MEDKFVESQENMETKKAINELLDWMKKNFKGDVEGISKEAAELAKSKGYISGSLWDEIGNRTMKIYFNEKLRFEKIFRFSELTKDEGEGEPNSSLNTQVQDAKPSPSSIFVTWISMPDGGVRLLGDLTKSECISLSEDYRKREKQNHKYATIYEKLADVLDNKTVKEVLTETETERLFADLPLKTESKEQIGLFDDEAV